MTVAPVGGVAVEQGLEGVAGVRLSVAGNLFGRPVGDEAECLG